MNEPITIIDVWAPWCRPCRAMEPIVDQAASQFAGRIAVEKVNADEQPGRVRDLKVLAVPTLIALQGDREISRLTGAQPEQAINDLFAGAVGDRTIGSKRLSPTDRTVRVAAAATLLLVGLLTGPAIPLLVAGVAIGATAVPRPSQIRASE